MKNILHIFYFLLICFFLGCSSSPFEKGLNQMKDFAAKGQSPNLGFSPSQAGDLWIDTTKYSGIYFIREDSIRFGRNLNESQILRTNRRYYPVRLGSRLCSTIAFDSTSSGWVAAAYTDSFAIKPFFDRIQLDSASGTSHTKYGIIMAPALQYDLLFKQISNTPLNIIPPQELRYQMAKNLHGTDSAAFTFDGIKSSLFLKVARAYIQDTI